MTVNYSFPSTRIGYEVSGTEGTANALNGADGDSDGYGDRWLAISFIAPPSGPTLSKVQIYCSAVTGTLTGLSCALFSDSSNSPGTQLAESTTVTALPTGAAWVEFTGFSYATTGGTMYWLVFRNTTATPASNYPSFAFIYSSLNMGAGAGQLDGYLVKVSSDDGATWTAITVRYSPGAYRVEWSDGGVSGWPVETVGSLLTGKAYGSVETGVKFTTPTSGKCVVSGLAAYIRKDGTPGSLQMRLYEGSTLVATTKAMAVANVLNGSTPALFFETPTTLKRNTVYRISIGCVSGGDSGTNYYRLYSARLKNDAASLALAPLRGWAATDYNGSTWTDTATICPCMLLLLDADTGEFAEPTQPAVGDVQSGVAYNDAASTGTFAVPTEAQVESGVGFGAGGTEFTGTLVASGTYPSEDDVRDGVGFGDGGTEYEGNMTLPAVADVRDGTTYGAGGTEYEGEMLVYSTWTETEKQQIRYRLGIDGTENTPTNTPVLGTVDANVVEWLGDACPATDVAGVPKVDTQYVLGTVVAPEGVIDANMAQVSGDSVAADNLEAAYDGTGYAGGTIKQGVDVVAISGDTTAADNLELMFDGTGYAGGTTKLNVNTSTITNDAITAAAIANGAIDANTFAAGAITAAAIATDAIDADALATDAVTEIGAAVKTAVEAAGSHLALIKTKTDFLPSATAGSAGGVFIVGANVGGVSITNNAGDALLIQSTGGNGQGMSLVGNGAGSGLKASGGGTAGTAAIYAAGMVGMSLNAIAGNGMEVIGTAGDIVADITGNVSGSVASVSGAVGSIGAGGITSSTFASGAITSTAMADNSIDSKVIAADAINAASLKADALTAIGAAVADAVYDESSAAHNALGSFGLKINDTYTQIYNILDDTGTNGVVVASTSKTGYKLASDGLDTVSTTAPTGPASNFREMLVQMWRRFFKKSTLTATELKTYADDGNTVVTTQAVSDSAGTETQGPAT